ncbi:NAD(P)-binding protein [Trametopsis cervina]|nr:NAD(P)-binding protein [Trametopsis cervina]
MSPRPVIVIAGIGNGTGMSIRAFSKELGYVTALIAKNKDNLESLASEIKQSGGDAIYYAVPEYTYEEMEKAFAYFQEQLPNDEIRAALWNVTEAVRKPFLEMKKEEIQKMTDADLVAGFGFAQQAVRIFKKNEVNENGKRGFLAFTSATGAKRGSPNCTISSPGKFAIRGLSQSIAKELKGDDIHVSHAIIDGMILTERWKFAFGDEWYAKRAQDERTRVHPASIAKAYVYLAQQDPSAWTWELDLRPSYETWTW